MHVRSGPTMAHVLAADAKLARAAKNCKEDGASEAPSLADLRALVRAELTTPVRECRARLMSTCRTTENTNTTNSTTTPSALSSLRATRTLASAHQASTSDT